MINHEEVFDAQRRWSDGLLKITGKHQKNEDYFSEASNFIDELYNYAYGQVLFKPTLAKDEPFRLTKKAALSYFVGGDADFGEDHGFALKSWTNVRWGNNMINIYDNIALVMGEYYFINNDGEVKVEFSLAFKKDKDGKLRIILHDSHLPYNK
jgi:hypothetical protein